MLDVTYMLIDEGLSMAQEGSQEEAMFIEAKAEIDSIRATVHNSDYVKCTNELYDMFDNPEGRSSTDILRILRKHFA